MLSELHALEKSKNRKILLSILSNIRYLAWQALPLRGRDWNTETKSEENSNFYQLLKLRAQENPKIIEWLRKRAWEIHITWDSEWASRGNGSWHDAATIWKHSEYLCFGVTFSLPSTSSLSKISNEVENPLNNHSLFHSPQSHFHSPLPYDSHVCPVCEIRMLPKLKGFMPSLYVSDDGAYRRSLYAPNAVQHVRFECSWPYIIYALRHLSISRNTNSSPARPRIPRATGIRDYHPVCWYHAHARFCINVDLALYRYRRCKCFFFFPSSSETTKRYCSYPFNFCVSTDRLDFYCFFASLMQYKKIEKSCWRRCGQLETPRPTFSHDFPTTSTIYTDNF